MIGSLVGIELTCRRLLGRQLARINRRSASQTRPLAQPCRVLPPVITTAAEGAQYTRPRWAAYLAKVHVKMAVCTVQLITTEPAILGGGFDGSLPPVRADGIEAPKAW